MFYTLNSWGQLFYIGCFRPLQGKNDLGLRTIAKTSPSSECQNEAGSAYSYALPCTTIDSLA